MKRFLTLVTILAVTAACTKSSVVYDGNDYEIGFRPVNSMSSKAPVSGTVYPDDVPFGVFAYHNLTTETTPTWAQFHASNSGAFTTYIDNKKFIKKQSGALSGFGGETAYYWPKTGTLAFAGYSPYDITATSITYSTASADTPGFTISGFEQGAWSNTDAENKTVDLMWFDVNDQNACNTPDAAVPVKFNHACSWLDFKLTGQVEESKSLFTITNVVLKNVYTKANFTSAATTPTWSDYVDDNLSDITLYSNDAGQELSATAYELKNLLVIPQNVVSKATSTGDKTYLEVKFKQNTSDNPLVQTVNLDITVGEGDNNCWVMGKHYIYDLSFGLKEIILAPSIIADWTTENLTLSE